MAWPGSFGTIGCVVCTIGGFVPVAPCLAEHEQPRIVRRPVQVASLIQTSGLVGTYQRLSPPRQLAQVECEEGGTRSRGSRASRPRTRNARATRHHRAGHPGPRSRGAFSARLLKVTSVVSTGPDGTETMAARTRMTRGARGGLNVRAAEHHRVVVGQEDARFVDRQRGAANGLAASAKDRAARPADPDAASFPLGHRGNAVCACGT